MAIECNPASLAEAAKCFNQGYGPLALKAFRIRLLCAALNGETMTCTPAALSELVACFLNMDAATLDAIETYLVCQVANSGGGGGGSDQIKIYVNDPNTEGIVPGDQTKGAVAYSGAGKPTYNWDTAQLLWI